mgnify:CR=1 FL=1
MASSMDRDLDEEDLDETSYERAETSDTDIDNDDSDGRGSKSEKVSSFYWNTSLKMYGRLIKKIDHVIFFH